MKGLFWAQESLVTGNRQRGFPKIRGTLLGVPIIGITVFEGSILGPPILGNYHIIGLAEAGPMKVQNQKRQS